MGIADHNVTVAFVSNGIISVDTLLRKYYSTLGGKTGKLDEAVNRELNVTKS